MGGNGVGAVEVTPRGRRSAGDRAWVPALVLAALPLMSAVLYPGPLGAGGVIAYPYWAGLPAPQYSILGSVLFWLVAAPLAVAVVAFWYRRGKRPAWRAPIAVLGGLSLLLVVLAGLAGQPTHGLFTPLLVVAGAAMVLGVLARSRGITVSGVWMAVVAWQFGSIGQVGGLFGWQVWVLGGGSGPALGGQLTILGLDHPAPALLFMTLPLAVTGVFRALRPAG